MTNCSTLPSNDDSGVCEFSECLDNEEVLDVEDGLFEFTLERRQRWLEFSECLSDEEVLDVDDGLSLEDTEPLNVSRDVLVFLHIQKTVGKPCQ